MLFAFVVLVGIGLLSARASLAADPDLTTPEGAVAAYIDGVAQQDLDAIIAVTSVDRMTTGFDFVGYVDRLAALVPMTPAPATSPFFQQINRAGATAQIAQQVRFLTYGLMTRSEILEGKTVPMKAAEATDFATVVRADRLAGLKVVRVAIPSPELLNSERYQKNSVKLARVHGADASTERLALLSFEGLYFTAGFTLLRYGQEWTVMSQTSPVSGMTSMGTPVRVTPEDFERTLNK
ncbi:MAG: hypothetical protein ACT4OK_06110 [Gemmobacter sp.]